MNPPVWSRNLAMLLLANFLSTVLAEEAKKPLRVSLVSENAAIQAGKKFTVALFLKHAPEHHSYWRFPGIVGVPTSVEWSLPKGFAASPIAWPTPEHVDMRGWKAYGYKKDVLLLIEITPPATLAEGSKVRLLGKSGWMCCSQQACTPGLTPVELELPVEKEARSDDSWCERFAVARKALPQALPEWSATASVNAEGGYRLMLSAEAPARQPEVAELACFNANGLVSSHEAHQCQKTAQGYVFELPAFDFRDKEAKRFQAVLVAEKGWKEGVTAWWIDVPLGNDPRP